MDDNGLVSIVSPILSIEMLPYHSNLILRIVSRPTLLLDTTIAGTTVKMHKRLALNRVQQSGDQQRFFEMVYRVNVTSVKSSLSQRYILKLNCI